MEGTSSSKIRVIIADDDALVRKMVGAMIEDDPGLDLVGVGEDADQALELAAQHEPDVAVLDLNMPGGGGFGGAGAAARIKAAFPDMRVLALTASDDMETKMKLANMGADGYIVKGASREQILNGIAGAMGVG
jgi:DNA-binding NarL/FixJ family response regulator